MNSRQNYICKQKNTCEHLENITFSKQNLIVKVK